MQNRMYGLPACKTHPSLSCPQITTTEKNQEARGKAKQGNKQEKKKKKTFTKQVSPQF